MVVKVAGAGLTGVLLMLGGCDFLRLTDPVMCPGVISRAIEVEVRDARSGQPAAHGAVGIAQEGDFVDSLRVVGWMSTPSPEAAVLLGGVEERPGVYSVRVEKQGYLPWARTGVAAREGVCGVMTARLQANLEPVEE
jgi:hypothetical protein